MSDKTELEKTYIFGQEAKKVIDNQAYQYATTVIKGDILSQLVNVEIIGDNDHVIELVRSLQSVNRIQDQLEKIMQEGSFAENNLLDQANNPNRYKRC